MAMRCVQLESPKLRRLDREPCPGGLPLVVASRRSLTATGAAPPSSISQNSDHEQLQLEAMQLQPGNRKLRSVAPSRRSAPRSPRSPPRCPRSAPRSPRLAPRLARSHVDNSRSAPRCSPAAPRCPRAALRSSRDAPRLPQAAPTSLRLETSHVQMGT